MQATFSGTVLSGVDVGGGTFGSAGQDLGGMSFRLSYVYDTETPGAVRDTSPTVDIIKDDAGPFDPIVSVILTINDQSFTLGDRYFSMTLARSTGTLGEYFAAAAFADNVDSIFAQGYLQTHVGSTVMNALFPASIETAFSMALTSDFFQSGEFSIHGCRWILTTCDQGNNINTSGQLSISHLTVTQVPVPPPFALLLSVLAGLGVMGGCAGRGMAMRLKLSDCRG